MSSLSQADLAAKRKEKLARVNRMRAELEAKEKENPDLTIESLSRIDLNKATIKSDGTVFKSEFSRYQVHDTTGFSPLTHEVDIQGQIINKL